MKKLTTEQNENIEKEVVCETRRRFEAAGFKVPKIARELALVAFSDIQDYVTVNEGGELQVLPLESLKKNKSRVIKKIREKTKITKSEDGQKLFKNSSVEFELYDKLDALKMAVEIIGIKKPAKVDVNHDGNIEILITNYAGASSSQKPRKGAAGK